jgi:hypothetical protein
VFVQPASGWTGIVTETAKLLPPSGTASLGFGVRVAADDGMVVVGHRQQRAVYLFAQPAEGWATGTYTSSTKLVPSGGVSSDEFGVRIAMDSDRIVVGAPFDTVAGNMRQGSVYVFAQPPTGWVNGATYTETAKLIASDGATDEVFGSDVALSGNVLVIGAYADDIGSANAQGSAYVFVHQALNLLYLPLIVR